MTAASASISLSIRRFEPAAKRALRLRAAQHQRSMEEEARQILYGVLLKAQATEAPKHETLFDLLRGRMGEVGGVDIPVYDRREDRGVPQRDPPSFA